MSEQYNMPDLGLFGKRCIIPTGYSSRPFVYRILNSGVRSNTWCEVPLTVQSERTPKWHKDMEEVIYVVLDTLINEESRILKVALKDAEVME